MHRLRLSRVRTRLRVQGLMSGSRKTFRSAFLMLTNVVRKYTVRKSSRTVVSRFFRFFPRLSTKRAPFGRSVIPTRLGQTFGGKGTSRTPSFDCGSRRPPASRCRTFFCTPAFPPRCGEMPSRAPSQTRSSSVRCSTPCRDIGRARCNPTTCRTAARAC